MSSYVANVVREALTKDRAIAMKALEAAYEEAEQDPARQRAIKEWSVLDADDNIE